MKIPFVVIGGGLSGLAAAIRVARFNPQVLLLEKHSRLGGLNSYFYRNKTLFETGLHAITNYADAKEKKAPLNRLLRQLKLPRKKLTFCQQYQSEVVFRGCAALRFSNDFELLQSQIRENFPEAREGFTNLLAFLADFDPFIASRPFSSAKTFLLELLRDRLLVDMLLCPLMYYGSSYENDMDLSQFAIMFRAIYLEGMFRPESSIKDFLDLLVDHYLALGGTVKKSCGVKKIIHHRGKAIGVLLESGEEIECDYLLSTIGRDETMRLLGDKPEASAHARRLGFVETIYQVDEHTTIGTPRDKTIIFYNTGDQFNYQKPDDYVDFSSGVICFPGNFQGLGTKDLQEIRSTHLANYAMWKKLSQDAELYEAQKKVASHRSSQCLEKIIGSFSANIVYENSFTPVTIERYTAKIDGAIYGNPIKTKNGDIGFANLFLAGTDQGFLGIIGSMLSGVSIVNQQILPKL